MKILLTSLLLFSLSIWGQNRQFAERIEFPEKIGQYKIEVGLGVYDFTKVFEHEEVVKLNRYLRDYNNQTNRTISVVTIDSIAPYKDFINLLTDLGNSTDINPEGFMIGISAYDRKVAVLPTLMSEKDLTPSILDKAVFEILIPHFKKEEFYRGVELALEFLIQQLDIP